jgi:hypothetical protein
MAHKLLSYIQSMYLVATFKKSSNLVPDNLVPTLKVGTLVPTLYVLWRHTYQTKYKDISQDVNTILFLSMY